MNEPTNMTGRLSDVDAIFAYMLAGNAKITLRSVKTGTRFTYQVKKGKANEKYPGEPPHFVGVLTGQNNDSDFEFLGTIFGEREIEGVVTPPAFVHGRRSRIKTDAPSAKAFAWFWRLMLADEMPERLEVWHEGTCGRCGRTLTVPESVERGIGPECAHKIETAALLASQPIDADDLLAGLL